MFAIAQKRDRKHFRVGRQLVSITSELPFTVIIAVPRNLRNGKLGAGMLV